MERIFLRVQFFRVLTAVCFFSLFALHALAQEDEAPKRRGSRIVDDTTKQIYGPNTSKYFYEADVFYNRPILHRIDTVIRNFHRFSYVQRFNNLYQDLGTIGTAIRPIYYQAPEVVGVRSGATAYDLYWDTEELRYYDTKSPYSNMNVVLGGKGRSLTKATFSRNINSRWNFGITYRGFFIDKQVPERRGKGDRIVRGNYYHFFTAYHTKDSIYRLFTNFRRMYHRVEEYGGAKIAGADSSFAEYFDPNVSVWLAEAESTDLRMNVHFHHEARVGAALQIYHTFDRYRQRSAFIDQYSADQAFFDTRYNVLTDTTKTNDFQLFKVVRNEVGLKGNLLKLFYNGYLARRHYNMTYNHWHQNLKPADPKGDENFVGGRMELNIDSVGLLSARGELNLESLDNAALYNLEGRIASRWFEASLKQTSYKPSFTEQAYIGGHNLWENNFTNIESSQINGYIHYRSKALSLSPGLTFTRLRNYIFFEKDSAASGSEEIFPIQTTGNQIIFTPEFRFTLRLFRNVTFTNQVLYNSLIENSRNAIRLPELLVNSQIAYSNIHFDGNFDIHTGVDLHWRSAYDAPAYDPALRQFYNQNDFKLNAYPLIDVFLNAKIIRGRIFLKWHNVVQVFRQTGYFTTPFYPGQRNIIDFGFDWSFYD
jgi:hypothetical protein